mgnify:CR=1 FL=1
MNILEPIKRTKLYGLGNYFNELIKLYKEGNYPNKILLSGQKGIGKSTLAFHFINYVLTIDEVYNYDVKNYNINVKSPVFKTIQNKSNSNLTTIDTYDDKISININQIRELISDLNKSSFNQKPRFVLIDNIELLNTYSVNGLLKFLEEPNNNVNFILINNNIMTPATLKSRCLNFKVSLSYENSISVANKLMNENILNIINSELLNNYTTPGEILKIIKLSDTYKIEIKNSDLKSFLSKIIKSKIYKKEKSFNDLIFSFIELYFRNNLFNTNFNLMYLYKYFIKKIHNTKFYNLDSEILFLEFEHRVLGG